MKYRRLGKSGLRVSVIGLGTWQLGGEWGKDFVQPEVDAMFDKARAVGINLIDTAECYGDHTSEQLVGGAIARDRQNWIVCTKFGHKFTGHLQRSEPREPDDVVRQLDDSLKALRTDYIDVYQYHSWGDKDFDRRGVLDVLRREQEKGKFRHLGNSIGGASSKNLHQLELSKEYWVEVIQIIYNRLDRRPEEGGALQICERDELGVLARVPLASGFLSGKYKPGDKFPPNDVRASMSPEQIEAKLREVEEIRKKEVPPGAAMAEWALAWCLQHAAVSAVIPGAKSVEQVEANARAAELPIVRVDHPQAWHE